MGHQICFWNNSFGLLMLNWNTLFINSIWYSESFPMHTVALVSFYLKIFRLFEVIEICIYFFTIKETVWSHFNKILQAVNTGYSTAYCIRCLENIEWKFEIMEKL